MYTLNVCLYMYICGWGIDSPPRQAFTAEASAGLAPQRLNADHLTGFRAKTARCPKVGLASLGNPNIRGLFFHFCFPVSWGSRMCASMSKCYPLSNNHGTGQMGLSRGLHGLPNSSVARHDYWKKGINFHWGGGGW